MTKQQEHKRAIELLRQLKDWESYMGGFDSPEWKRVDRFLGSVRRREDKDGTGPFLP